MPLPPKVRGIHNALPVGRKLRPCSPSCFLRMNFSWLCAGLCLHPPETAGSVDVIMIRNVYDLAAIGRPGRTDFMIDRTVIETLQGSAILSSETLYVS